MIRKSLFASVALALLATTTVAAPASAAHAKKMKMAKKVKLVPSALKPGYRGLPGYVGGGPRMAGTPAMNLIDVPLVPAGKGALNAGILPSSGFFKGVPVLETFNF